MATVRVPNFEWSGFYHGEILEDLIQWVRDQELQLDESPEEPFIQLLEAFSTSAHLNNVLLDLVANEMYLPTARLRDSVAALLALIDYHLAQATPATAMLVHRVTQVLTSAVVLMPAHSVFATRATATETPIEFETGDALSTTRTDQVDACFAYDASANIYTDHTADANNPLTQFTPGWGGAGSPGDILYVGHQTIAWNRVRVNLFASAVGISGIWEFFDGDWDDSQPDLVTNIGTGLRLDLNGFLGTATRVGTIVRVRCNQTGVYQDVSVQYGAPGPAGTNWIATTGFLGQTVPSTQVRDYTVGRAWDEMEGTTDASASFTAAPGNRDVDYTLPKNDRKWWTKTTINGVEAYWVRFRLIAVTGPVTDPSITQLRIHDRQQFVFTDVTQGRTREDAPLASSTGLPDQEYELNRFPVIDDDNLRVYVTEGAIESEWTRVDTFLTSNSVDKHFTVVFDSDSRATIVFGDGTNGKIPMAGVGNIRATYRTMEDQDGNVGTNTVVVNRGGVAYIAETTNPRKGSGWSAREGDTEQELERAKIVGPASLRTFGKATAAPDVVTLVEAYKTSEGSKMFSRCLAIEGGFGPKTVEAVVVKLGGGLATVDELDDLELYFNGDTARKVRGIIVMNQQVVARNYSPRTINIVADVYGGNLTSAVAAVTALLNPEARAKNADGTESTEWEWEFGETVPVARIITALMESEPRPRNVVVTTPAADVVLLTRELPIVGTVTLNIIP